MKETTAPHVPLGAEALHTDPRVIQARQWMRQALSEHQQRLSGVRPPDPRRRIAYEKLLEDFGGMRGADLYYPYLGTGLGNGPLVELADGSVKYDMISGIGVHYAGHGSDLLTTVAFDAVLEDVVMQGNLQQNASSMAAMRALLDLASRGASRLAHCLFSTSGAMANENALKMVFQKRHPASRLLAFNGAFVGRTLALAQVTDCPVYRDGLPTTMAVDYIPYFCAGDPEGSTQSAVQALRTHLTRYPDQHAAMIFELVLGEGGFYPGSGDFFRALIDVLRAHNVLVIVDEVQTFGRTSQPFAFQHFQLEESVDVATVGKVSQLCATLFTPDLSPRPGLVSQTYTASTTAIYCGRRIFERMAEGDLFGAEGRIERIHHQFVERLTQMGAHHPGSVAGPFGIGGMIAFVPFDGSRETATRFNRTLFDAGVIAFVTGSGPVRCRFLPPLLALQPHDVDAVCDIVEGVVKDFVASRQRAHL